MGAQIVAFAARRAPRKPAVISTEEFMVDGIAVRVARKRMKNTTMRVKTPDGPVEVSAPLAASRASIERLVRAHASWISDQQRKLAQSTMAQANQATAAEVKAWRTIIEALAPELVAHWAQVMGVKPGRLAYRNMKSRWGSCQPSTGRICLNVRLALYPPECLEYVVVHELCHLIEPNHGPAFHALMDRYLPDWRTRRAKLR